MTVVHVHFYGLGLDWVGKARPSAATIVFEVGVENRTAAAIAGINACFLSERVITGERSFRSFFAQYLVGQRIQLLLPFFLGFLDGVGFIFHR